MKYAQVIDLALAYSDRTDSDIKAHMDSFLLVLEARINRAIRVSQMATRSTVWAMNGDTYFGLPKGFAGMRDIEVRNHDEAQGQTAQYLNPEQMNAKDILTSSNMVYYTIIANQIQIYPPQTDKKLEIVYYKTLDPLTSKDDSNWLSDRYPDCYVFGLLVEIQSFVKNPEGADMWNKRFESALVEMAHEDLIDRWSGTPMQTRVG